METVVLHRVGFLAYSCRKQGQDFKPSAAPLYPNMGKVQPPPWLRLYNIYILIIIIIMMIIILIIIFKLFSN